MDPQDVHILIPRTFKHISHGRRIQADVMELSIQNGKITLDYLSEPNIIMKVLRKGE